MLQADNRTAFVKGKIVSSMYSVILNTYHHSNVSISAQTRMYHMLDICNACSREGGKI